MFEPSSLVIFFVLGIIGLVTYKLYIWPTFITPLRKIPGPPPENIFFGSFNDVLAGKGIQFKWAQKYGKVVKYHALFNQPSILVTDTKIIQDMTLNHVYDFIKPPHMTADAIEFTGRGLVFVEGNDHKRQRKMMTPAFTHSKIKEMVPTFIQVSSTLVGLIEAKINLGEPNINLTPYITQTTLDMIGLVGFSYEFNSLTSSNELAEAYDNLMNTPFTALTMVITMLSYYIPSVRDLPLDMNKKFKDAIAIIDRVSRKLVEEKTNEAKNGELKGKDLLSFLININKTLPVEEKITDEELKYQIMTFLVAGHETTSTATTWALYFLTKYPHEQDLLREELVKAFPDKSKFNPTFDQINSLEYLNCIIKEVLRLCPPVPVVSRTNVKDEMFGEYFIPKNSIIEIAISALHESPEVWGPTASDFNPKRWLDTSLIKNVSNLNYLPFFTGTRSCIGSKVALTEFKILLGMLIRNFVFQPIEGFQMKKRTFPMTKVDPYLGLSISKVEG